MNSWYRCETDGGRSWGAKESFSQLIKSVMNERSEKKVEDNGDKDE